MFERFFPDKYLDSAYVVNYEKLYQEGYRGILFDIDNTWFLMGHRQIREAVRFFRSFVTLAFPAVWCQTTGKKGRTLPLQ